MRNLRFGTEAGTSLIDGKPALLMYYGAYNEGNTLIDEIRQLSHDIFLGMGTRETEDGGYIHTRMRSWLRRAPSSPARPSVKTRY